MTNNRLGRLSWTRMMNHCTACGETLPSGARFCSACGAPVAAQPVAPPPVTVDVPPELRAKFESVRADLRGDRRQVVMVFADLQGYTTLSEQLDPEEVTILVGGLLQELAAAVHRYEGYVDKFMGDAIMALFGAPLAHEDDAERAVLAGLEMLEAVARRRETGEMPLALRVGIHSGEVVAAHLGDGLRLQYTVVGDAVNVAARLEHAAEPNTVLVSDAIYTRVAHRFEAVTLDPIAVKGRVEPIKIYRMVRWREGPQQNREAPTFVGRTEELAAIEGVLGRGGVAVLEGEAGAGKSRLAREGVARVVREARIVELGFASVRRPGERPAMAELFRQLSDGFEAAVALAGEGHRGGLAGLAREAMLEAPPEDETADPAEVRSRRWRALAALLVAAARERPIVLLVEDLHWADEEALELLAFLLPTMSAARIPALFTARPDTPMEGLPA